MNTLLRPLNRTLVLLVSALILAACGGGDAPTDEPTPLVLVTPSAPPEASPQPTIVDPFGTLEPLPEGIPLIGATPDMATDEGVFPGGIGTLVAVGTMDPSIEPGFREIILVRTGGPVDENGNSLDLTITLTRDGTITANGRQSTVSQARVDEIASLIDAVNIFGLQTNYVGAIPLQGEQPYLYQLLIKKEYDDRLITGQAGLMPREIDSIISAVLAQGLAVGAP